MKARTNDESFALAEGLQRAPERSDDIEREGALPDEPQDAGFPAFESMSNLALVMAYEDGSLPDEYVLPMFRRFVENGMINSLQGHYQRTAYALFHKEQ